MGSLAQTAVKLLSWNIHSFVGRGGNFAPDRTASLVRDVDPDIAVFQEVDFRGDPSLSLDILKPDGGDHVIAAPSLGDGDQWYGQALISKCPISREEVHDLSVDGREPRKLIEAYIDLPDTTLRVLATHLGLKRIERRRQLEIIKNVIVHDTETPTILAGDLNEWWGSDHVIRKLFDYDKNIETNRLKTFPSRLPIFSLDRIASRPSGVIKNISRLRRNPDASDHLPLVATLNLGHN